MDRIVEIARCRGIMHKIQISHSRIVSGDFAVISDDYLIRPAKQDFWRLESKDGGDLVVTQIISSSEEDGVPDILETGERGIISAALHHNPKRIADPGIAPEIKEFGLANDGLFVFLDTDGHTYKASEIINTPIFRSVGARLKQLMIQLEEVQNLILRDQDDTGWGPQYQALKSHLMRRGPIELEGMPLRSIQGLVDGLHRALSRSQKQKRRGLPVVVEEAPEITLPCECSDAD